MDLAGTMSSSRFEEEFHSASSFIRTLKTNSHKIERLVHMIHSQNQTVQRQEHIIIAHQQKQVQLTHRINELQYTLDVVKTQNYQYVATLEERSAWWLSEQQKHKNVLQKLDNCGQENALLRSELKEKEKNSKAYLDKNRGKEADHHKLKKQIQHQIRHQNEQTDKLKQVYHRAISDQQRIQSENRSLSEEIEALRLRLDSQELTLGAQISELRTELQAALNDKRTWEQKHHQLKSMVDHVESLRKEYLLTKVCQCQQP